MLSSNSRGCLDKGSVILGSDIEVGLGVGREGMVDEVVEEEGEREGERER